MDAMWADSTEQRWLQSSSQDGAEARAHMKPHLTWCLLPCSFISDCTRILVSCSASREPGLSLVQFSHSVVSDSLRPHRLQHARPPCPSPTPRVYANSSPLSQRCHPTISSSAIPFSSCIQSFPASGPFLMAKVLEFQLQHQSF